MQSAQLVLLFKHLSAYARGKSLRYGRINGPVRLSIDRADCAQGEALTVMIMVMAARGLFGLDWLENRLVWAVQVRHVALFDL